MESNNIIAAPEVDGVHIFYDVWLRTNVGSIKSFYKFMTTPTPGRDEFIRSIRDDVDIVFNMTVTQEILRESR